MAITPLMSIFKSGSNFDSKWHEQIRQREGWFSLLSQGQPPCLSRIKYNPIKLILGKKKITNNNINGIIQHHDHNKINSSIA